MQQKQVDIVRTKAAQHFINAFHGLALAVLAGPQLAGDPDLLAGDAAFLHGLADTTLVLVGMGRVDMPIAHLQSCEAGFTGGFVTRNHIDPKAKLGDLVSVIQSNISLFHRCFPPFFCYRISAFFSQFAISFFA